MREAPDPSPTSGTADARSSSAWALPEIEPTNLLALWPDDQAPCADEIVRAFAARAGGDVEVLEELESDPLRLTWAIALRVPGREEPLVAWTEPAHPLDPEEREALGVRDCRWIVGVETRLDRADPLTSFVDLVRLLAGSLADAPAVLDVNTARWFKREELEETFGNDEVEPPVDVLWVIHGVAPAGDGDGEGDAAQGGVWLHTHGLWRCGAPELEMLEVPVDRADCAAELIGDVAGLLLERTPPEPGEPFEIGTDLRVVLQPWQEVARFVDDGAPGGEADRRDEDEHAHVGVRAAICAERPAGRMRAIWVWPEEVVRRLAEDEAGVYMTRRATERQGRLARAGWCQLAMAFATWSRRRTELNGLADSVLFGVKAGFAMDHDPTSREHLWFEVLAFDGDRVHAALVNQPLQVKRIERGAEIWVDRADVSDWIVRTPCGCFGPTDVPGLWRTLDALLERGDCVDLEGNGDES